MSHIRLPILAAVAALAFTTARAGEKSAQLVLSTRQLEPTTTFEIRFSEPIVGQAALGKPADPPPLIIAPAVKGRFLWLSARSGVFTPTEPLPLSTTFKLALRSDLKNAAGADFDGVLDETVETPAFKVKGHSTNRYLNQQDASAEPSFNLLFNADVRAADAARFLKFIADGGQTVAARVVQADALRVREHNFPRYRSDDRSLLTWTARFAQRDVLAAPGVRSDADVPRQNQLYVTPVKPLPVGGNWRLLAESGVPSSDGTLRTLDNLEIEIGDVKPFTVRETSPANGGVDGRRMIVTFTKPLAAEVTADTVSRWIHVSPEPAKLKAVVSDRTVTLRGDFVLDEEYELTVDPGLPAREPFTLAEAFTDTFAFEPVAPRLRFEGFAEHQLSSGRRKFHLHAVNVPRIRVTAKLFQPDTLPAAIVAYEEYLDPPNAKEDEPYRKLDPDKVAGRILFSKEFTGTDRTDVDRQIALNWDEILGAGKTGVVLVTAEQAGAPTTPGERPGVQAIVQITDLGVVWKNSAKETFAHAFSLASGGQLGGVKLTLLDEKQKPMGEAVTGDTGAAQLPPIGEARWLLAQRGDDLNLIPLQNYNDRISLWRFKIPRLDFEDEGDGTSGSDGRQIFLFTERAVYKPGEIVHFKGIVRDRRGNQAQIPAGAKAVLLAVDAREREFFRKEVTISALGSVNEDIQLPKGVLGEYHLSLQMRGEKDESPSVEHHFQVQEYTPNAFEISIGGPKSFTGVQSIEVPIGAKYYMGKPLSKAQLTWSIEANDAGFTPDGFDDFDFCHAIEDYRMNRELDRVSHFSDQGKLDLAADGTAAVALQMPWNPKAPQPRAGRLLCEITDLDQQTVSEAATITLHPSDFYLGIGELPDVVRQGDKLAIPIVAVRNDGAPQPEPVAATLRLTRVDWENTRVETAGYASEFRNEPHLHRISETKLTTQRLVKNEREHKWTVADGAKPAQITAGTPGLYLLEAVAKDSAGRDAITSTTFYVTGETAAEWDYRNQFVIDLVPDKTSYESGETAHILVKTPIAGDALVTIERERVIRSFTVKLSGNAPSIDVPLLGLDAPNVFVSVMLLRGASDSPRKFKAPEYRVGYTQLKVTRAEAKLAVHVAPASRGYQPGDEVTLTADVLDFRGKPRAGAEVALYAVDEGVLSLTGYETPNPLAFFNQPLPLAVATSLTLPSLMNEDPENRDYANKGYLIGGGGDDFGDRMRKNFITCAFWNASLRTDENGRVTATFPAPDSLTRYRVIAVVQTEADEFGSAESAFEVSKPVMLEPALPRFANVGDKLLLRGVLHNQTEFDGEVEVRVELDDTAAAESTVRRVLLAAHGSLAVDFPVEFKTAGTAKWKWTARFLGDDGKTAFRDSVETTLAVNYPVPVLREVHVSRTDAAQSDLLHAVNPALLDGTGIVRVSVTNTRMIELGETVKYLLHYPYGCVEQTTSSTLPWLTLRDFRDVLPDLRKTDAEIRGAVNAGIDRLFTMQTDSGGLAYWPGGNEPLLWASGYGGLGIALAKRAGFDVPAEDFDRLCQWTSQQLRGIGSDTERVEHYEMNARCLALCMLATAGRAEPGYHEMLFKKRDSLTSENRALLALAIVESNGPAAMIEELLNPKHSSSIDDGWYWCASRGQALRLMALSRHQPKGKAMDLAVTELFGSQLGGHWRTTQGNAWSLLALSDYFKRVESQDKTVAGTLVWGAQKTAFALGGEQRAQFAEFPLTADSIKNPLRVMNPDRKQVFTEVSIESRPRVIQQPRQDRGYAIRRAYAKVGDDGSLSDLENMQVGDRVLVTLNVEVRQSARYLVVDDPLPSVFEAINPAFKSQETRAGEVLGTDWAGDFQELRDDRALFFADYIHPGQYTIRYLARVRAAGTATAPAAKVEEMYHPERFGLTETQIVTARPLK